MVAECDRLPTDKGPGGEGHARMRNGSNLRPGLACDITLQPPCNRTPAWHARVRHISCSLRRCALTGDDGTHQAGIHRSLLRAWLQGRGPATFGQLQVLPRGKQSSPLVALRRHCNMTTARGPEPPSVAMLEYMMLDHTRLDHMMLVHMVLVQYSSHRARQPWSSHGFDAGPS